MNQATIVDIVAYASRGKDAAVSAPTNSQLAVLSARVFNRSGGAVDVGLMKKFADGRFKVYAHDGSTTYTELSFAAAETIVSTTNDEGFVVGSKQKSGLVGFTVSQASTGNPVYVYKYWNGSVWSTLTTVATLDMSGTGDKIAVFIPPHDWVKGGDGDLPSSDYHVKLSATTAPSQAVEATAVWVAGLIEFIEAVGDNGSLEVEFEGRHPLILEAGEGLMPYFGTANAANGLRAAYTTV